MERTLAQKNSLIRQPSFTERVARGLINEPDHRPPSVDLSYANISAASSYPTSSRFDGASTWDASNYVSTAASSYPDPRKSDGMDSAGEGKQRFSSAQLDTGSSTRRSYAETLFSVNSAVGDHHLVYIESFSEHLCRDLTSSNGSSALNVTPEVLEKTLKEFALILHEESHNPFQWDASITLYKTRQSVQSEVIPVRYVPILLLLIHSFSYVATLSKHSLLISKDLPNSHVMRPKMTTMLMSTENR